MNNDLISRAALKDAIENQDKFACLPDTTLVPFRMLNEPENNYEPYVHLRDIRNAIDNAPTVPQVTVFTETADETAVADLKAELQSVIEPRPQGEWARHDEWRGGEYIGGFYHVNCPCEDGYYSKWRTNFCPNCGADMRGGAE